MTTLERRQCWVRLAQYCDELLAGAARNGFTASYTFTYSTEKRELLTVLGLRPPRTQKALEKLREHSIARTKWLIGTKWHTEAPTNYSRSQPHQRNRCHCCKNPRPTQQNHFHSRTSPELPPLPAPRFFDGGIRRQMPAPMPLQRPQQVLNALPAPRFFGVGIHRQNPAPMPLQQPPQMQNIMGSSMQPPPPAVQQMFKFHAQLLLQNPQLMRAHHHRLQQQMLPMAGTFLPQTQSNIAVPPMWLPAQHNRDNTLAAQNFHC